MKKFIFAFAVMAAFVGCSDDDALIGNGGSVGTTPERPVRTFTCSAGMEGATSRTTLEGRNVLWDAGDEFRIKKQGTDFVLDGTMTQKSSGLGVKVSKTSGTAYVRYEYIKVESNGTDITSTVTAASASSGNSYKLGIYTPSGKYHYPPAGTIAEAEINLTGAVPLIQASSSSTAVPAHVILKNIEYSLDKTNWIKVTDSSQLVNGFNNKNQVTYTFTQDGLDLRMTLGDEPGKTIGEFTGETTSLADIDATTMAVFPYAAFTGYNENNLSIALPEVQHYAENSFDHQANIMAGSVSVKEGTKCDAAFKNMCGLLQLSLTGENINLATITVTDRGSKQLWGKATVPVASYADGISCTQLAGGSATLTLDCSGATLTSDPTLFTFVVPVGAFANGFDVTVTTDDHRSQTFGTSKANTISRNGIVKMPAVAINNLSEVIVNVENDAVQKYMSYGKYASFGSTSYFGTYSSVLNNALCMDQDRPATFGLTWTGSASATYTVTLTDKTKGSDVYTDRSVTGNSYSITNLIPGHSYAYVVKSGGTTVRSGEFNTTGQVRMVTIDDTWNCRDLGGWTGLNGNKVKYEWLYRTGSLNGTWVGSSQTSSTIAIATNYIFSEKGKQQVRDLGILAELDLRGRTGDGQAWSQESGMHSRSILTPHISIASADFKQIMTDQGLQNPLNVYSVVQDVAWIIDQVVNKNHPVAFHCKSGADRTGAVGMIILSLLGVDQGDVARDYELTTMSREKKMMNGSSAFQTRRADQTSYGFFKNGFTTLATGANAQEKAYYYLNQHFKSSGVAISSTDLDAFIKKMLGLSSYTHPSFAQTNSNTLESIYNK